MSQLMKQYFEWWRYSSKESQFLVIDRRVLVAMIDNLDEEKVVDIATSISLITMRDFLRLRFGKLDTKTMLEFLDTLDLHMNWGNLKTTEEPDGGIEVLVTHALGIKWSIFVSEFISNMLSSYLNMRTATEYSTFGCTVIASRS